MTSCILSKSQLVLQGCTQFSRSTTINSKNCFKCIAVPFLARKGDAQMRFAHTDIAKVPDFTAYRKKSTLDPAAPAINSDVERKAYGYGALLVGTAVLTYGTKNTLISFLTMLSPNARTLAEASIEVDLTKIPEGKNAVFKWRNKPLFIRHRTQDEIDRERSVNISELRDPMDDKKRVTKDEWLILIGICTHLGCVPISHAGDFGGYYCPCHGSHYDASGRIRKGPAPLNLEIPEHRYASDSLLVVG